ncbi:hypothetical protein BRD17_09830 [Halobacteriales archaeon SW_7_68_16]|nr:MAG: hypothetical protein BRD17_09830 [Halobacteriales archaeon SW_7_68_16]
MAVTESLIAAVVSLLVGGMALYAGARVVAGINDYSHAVVTALIAAVVWAVVATLVGGVPLLGPVLVLGAYLSVVRWRYGLGWVDSAVLAVVAWIAGYAILIALATAGILSPSAVGVPGI